MTDKKQAGLLCRIAAYPDQVQAVVAEGAGLSKKARELQVNPKGNLARETQRFAGNLRAYDLALKLCAHHGEVLITAMRADQTLLNAYLARYPSDTTAATSSVLLTQNLATLSSAIALCEDLRKTVQTARQALTTMKDQSELAKLVAFAAKLQTAKF